MSLKAIAIIPARAGSKGLSGKNTKKLAGMPLYQHAIKQAQAAGISDILISTDSSEILDTNHANSVRAIKRPDHLATDATPMIEVLTDLVAHHIPDDRLVVLLQPTSPLRRADHIRGAMDVYAHGTFDIVVSAVEMDRSILKAGLLVGNTFNPINKPEYVFSNRQSLPPVYKHNGAIYIFSRNWLHSNQSFDSDRIGLFEMSVAASLDIDNADDFARCEAEILKRDT